MRLDVVSRPDHVVKFGLAIAAGRGNILIVLLMPRDNIHTSAARNASVLAVSLRRGPGRGRTNRRVDHA